MLRKLGRTALGALVFSAVAIASANTYGNTSPFETESGHSPNFVLGVQVTIPQTITLQSFGLIYGNGDTPPASNAIFGLYSSGVSSGLPLSLQAVTNPINVNTAQIYDNIAFTTTPTINAGTYWMMALYESFAGPRMSLVNTGSLVAYWSTPYSGGMQASAPAVSTYNGQNFNYWVNGTPVPEPASLAILGIGAAGMALRKRRRA